MPVPNRHDDTPEAIRPYKFHGVDFTGNAGQQWLGVCVFCGKVKFYINETNGKWDCKGCAQHGNFTDWMRLLWKKGDEQTNDYNELTKARGLLYPDTLMQWGVVKSPLTGEWLVPGYNVGKALTQLYRYVKLGDKYRLLATPTIGHAIHGVNLFDPTKPDVHILEGPWDAMIWWETLKYTKRDSTNKLVRTANINASLLKTVNVLAYPGANVFQEKWAELLRGKNLTLLYDNDYPNDKLKPEPPITRCAGTDGMIRVCQVLAKAENKPETVSYLHWGDAGFDLSLPSGYDIRDAIKNGETEIQRLDIIGPILGDMVRPTPAEWVAVGVKSARAGSVEITPAPCSEWKVIHNAWRKALMWTEGLDRAFSVMLAAVLSTDISGDQLWVKIISPPSGGKSTLCEALSICKQYVFANSTMTGIHSGWKTDRKGEEDHSLIPKIKGKTLVIKDADTLLQSANKDKTLSELRDLYDRTSRVHYAHGVRRDYENINLTIILCGTASLRAMDTSELGERFIDCVIMSSIDTDVEDEINWRAINKMRAIMSNGRDSSDGDNEESMLAAKRLTGGYVEYLRRNAHELLAKVSMDDEAARICNVLGKFVAHMRARPSPKQDEDVVRELSTRLVTQFVRLSYCLAAVMGRTGCDDEVMRRVTRCALDTARGRTLLLIDRIVDSTNGAIKAQLALDLHESEEKVQKLLTFLGKIEVIEAFKPHSDNPHISQRNVTKRYRLTEPMRNLYNEVNQAAGRA